MTDKMDKTYTIEKRRGKFLVMWTAPGRGTYVARKCKTRDAAENFIKGRRN